VFKNRFFDFLGIHQIYAKGGDGAIDIPEVASGLIPAIAGIFLGNHYQTI
jgi:hypothetical protein